MGKPTALWSHYSMLWSGVPFGRGVFRDVLRKPSTKPSTISSITVNGYVFTNGTQFLLIATERACGSSANHKLADQRAGFLKQHGAVDNGHSHKACHSPRICFAQDAKVSPSDCAGGNGRNFGVGFGAVGQDDSAGAHIGGAHPESQLLESRQ